MPRRPTLQDEISLELEAADANGRLIDCDRMKAADRKRPASGKVGALVVSRLVREIAQMLERDLHKASPRGGGGMAELKALSGTARQDVCRAATRAALNRLGEPVTRNALARLIGDAAEDALKWQRWEVAYGKGGTAKKRTHQRALSIRHHSKVRRLMGERDDLLRTARKPWGPITLIGVGGRFIGYLRRAGIVEIVGAPRGSRRPTAVKLTEKALKRWDTSARSLVARRSRAHPLLVPPVPWTSPQGGGFHLKGTGGPLSDLPAGLSPLPLVRRDPRQGGGQAARLAEAGLSIVYAGLNALQDTPWRINRRLFRVLEAMVASRRKIPGRSTVRLPLPERLTDEEFADEARAKKWRAEARAKHLQRDQALSRRIALRRTLEVAKKFATCPAIYFAHNLDFRGRVYACSDDMSPQGNDLQRGLLEFARGDRLTKQGVRWLKIHLANCAGQDKASFADRVKWADANNAMIRACAANPLGDRRWCKADSPWRFLAACFAWADYERSGLGAICRIPVMLDGSCSGLQHWAALLQDKAVGKAVNLVPSAKPNDLYRDVAALVRARLEATPDRVPAGKGNKARWVRSYAAEWAKFGIDRKLVKRSVMVLPYGGTKGGNPEHLLEAVRERLDKRPKCAFWQDERELWSAVCRLSDVVWQVMHECLKGPLAGMTWVHSVVEEAQSQNPSGGFSWVSPCGFPVVIDYRKPGHAQPVETTEGILSHWPLSEEFNWKQAKTAAAPNFIHSLDASHLLISVDQAARLGLRQLAAVHDAFATTPSKTDKLWNLLRNSFAELYSSGNLLERLSSAYPGVRSSNRAAICK